MRTQGMAGDMSSRDVVPILTTSPLQEAPRPLVREMQPADPFPVDVLGSVLASAAHAIYDRVQAPIAICGQSVLGAATLAVQAQADVVLPTRQVRPLTNYYLTVAATGERKTAVDHDALRPVHRRERALREAYAAELHDHENSRLAWEKSRDHAIKNAKGDRACIKATLDSLGPAPIHPLEPVLTCTEPTYEGRGRLFAIGWPSLGIFSSEGGQFIGGHGMTDDAKLRTAAGLSALWDGAPIKRVRATDGVLILPGRRLAVHLMAQPDVASTMLNDRLLADQGLLSRILATAPDPSSGSRMWRLPDLDSEAALERYDARLFNILELRLPLAAGTQHELAPRKLPLSPDAQRLWIAFHDHIEPQIASGRELDPVRGLANKLPEHAARMAGVLMLIRDIDASEIAAGEMEAGIELAQHYATEALRLFAGSRVSDQLRLARQLVQWLHKTWTHDVVSLPDIYQHGPSAIRDKATATRVVSILEDHGHLIPISGGAEIKGQWRRYVWRLNR
jgi:hypothetical protein